MTRAHFGPLVLPPLINAITEGRPVTFGALTLDGDGILNTRSSTAIAWTSVGLIEVRGQVHIEVKDSRGRYATRLASLGPGQIIGQVLCQRRGCR